MLTKQEAFLIRLVDNHRLDAWDNGNCECCGAPSFGITQNVITNTLKKILCWNCYQHVSHGHILMDCPNCEERFA